MEITLDDVDTAIKILREFLRKEKEARRVLKQIGIREVAGYERGLSFEKFIQSAFEEAQRRKLEQEGKVEKPTIEEEEPEITEEELARIKEIKEKLKKEVKPEA